MPGTMRKPSRPLPPNRSQSCARSSLRSCFRSHSLLATTRPIRSPSGGTGPAIATRRPAGSCCTSRAKPYERGYQHGRLMAPEIAEYVAALAADRSAQGPRRRLAPMRLLANALFLRKFDAEYLEEMKGIADGAAAAGASFDGRPLDLHRHRHPQRRASRSTFLDGALDATATGLEGKRFPSRPRAHGAAAREGALQRLRRHRAGHRRRQDRLRPHHHVRNLYHARHYNVWLDIKPDKGHRVLMQTYPGGIMSGLDYYMNDAGLVVCETTIEQTALRPRRHRRSPTGSARRSSTPTRSTTRSASSGKATTACTPTNGCSPTPRPTRSPCSSWARTRRSSGGAARTSGSAARQGFYWGCNNAKDLQVRLETISDPRERPRSTAWVPSARDKKWLEFYAANRGKITAEAGKRAFSTPPICTSSSLDAKVTTTALMKDLKTLAVFGPPIGGTWQPTDHQREEFPEVVPLVPNDWTVLHPNAPAKTHSAKAADLSAKAQAFMSFSDRQPPGIPHTKAAWHGTLLAKSDADLWLTEGFAAYERIVAMEHALWAEHDDGKLSEEDHERLALEINLHCIHILPKIQTQVDGQKEVPLERSRLVRSETGRGVLRVRRGAQALGDDRFVELMEEFGLEHAGKEVTGGQFAAFIDQHKGKTDSIDWHVDQSPDVFQSPKFTVRSWAEEQEHSVIVYGTMADVEANRETAELLQRTIAKHGTNIVIPILSDLQATSSPDKVTGKHVLLIGGPTTNKLCRSLHARSSR